jgi:chromosome segregation ATPase
VGRAARAEGELAARAQEIEQAYRRLAGFEADLDAARAELGDRDVRLSQTRDRLSELETKVGDYEDQIVRAFQRLRSDEKTTEKIRRALGVALALLDERAVTGQPGLKPAPASDEAEKS